MAGAIGAILALVTSCSCWSACSLTPLLIDVIAPGFQGPKRELTIRLVRDPVSRRRPAGAVGLVPRHSQQPSPVLPLLHGAGDLERRHDCDAGRGSAARQRDLDRLAVLLAWGSVVGQRAAFRRAAARRCCAGEALRVRLDRLGRTSATVIREFGPVFVSRGVVQISAYIDAMLASLLPTRRGGRPRQRTAALHAAGEPVRHVGLGRGTAGHVERGRQRRTRWRRTCGGGSTGGLRQIAFFIVPSAMAFLALGRRDRGGGARKRGGSAATIRSTSGAFSPARPSAARVDAGRLYSSTYYALRDTRTPLRYAIVRVSLTTALGYVAPSRSRAGSGSNRAGA